jgi:hypothetical protein
MVSTAQPARLLLFIDFKRPGLEYKATYLYGRFRGSRPFCGLHKLVGFFAKDFAARRE